MIRAVAGGTLILLALVSGCSSSSGARPDDTAVDPGVYSLFDLVAGRWDWARGDSTCLGNQHAITFSPDGSEMLLTFDRPLDSTSVDPHVRYWVLAAGGGVHDGLPYVLRTSMAGETRTTETGELVLWDLILASPNRYHWHRVDWAGGGVTNAVIRCDGTQPLEVWEVPEQ